MMESLYQMDDDARLYVYAASRELTGPEIETLTAEVETFIRSWQAHRQALSAACGWTDNRFLFVAIDESVTPLSGCSIDNLVRTVRALEAQLGVTFVDGDAVYFRQGTAIRRAVRSDFKQLAREGLIGPDTIVFNTTITRIADLRAGRFEVPLCNSWHARLVQGELAGA